MTYGPSRVMYCVFSIICVWKIAADKSFFFSVFASFWAQYAGVIRFTSSSTFTIFLPHRKTSPFPLKRFHDVLSRSYPVCSFIEDCDDFCSKVTSICPNTFIALWWAVLRKISSWIWMPYISKLSCEAIIWWANAQNAFVSIIPDDSFKDFWNLFLPRNVILKFSVKFVIFGDWK